MTPRKTSPEAFFTVARTRADRPRADPAWLGRTPPHAPDGGRGTVHLAGPRRPGAFSPLPTRPAGSGHLASADLAAAIGPVDHSFETTAAGSVMATAVTVLRPGGSCALVGSGGDELTVRPSALAGRSLRFVIEGDAVPQQFIPRLIELWRQGRFPFERLIRTYPLDDIASAERAAADGTTVKPVLLPHHP
ncbi:hypothetical protein [Streptomyces sp. NPDC006012]|uniref:hypothetical protein n=1 Tax=Streptomyces sp. NPDC006012 TaxID=3364739 RepID=UPI0036A07267